MKGVDVSGRSTGAGNGATSIGSSFGPAAARPANGGSRPIAQAAAHEIHTPVASTGDGRQALPSVHGGMARSRVRAAVAVRDLAFHQEVLDYLSRQPRIEVVASWTDAAGPASLRSAPEEPDLDAVVVCPVAARAIAGASASQAPTVFLVAEEMTVPVLRTAIEAGAQGAFCWPEERSELGAAMAASSRPAESSRARGRVIAVLGARGGVGATFVASHLAAAFARAGSRAALVDMDPSFGDLTAALGLVEDDHLASIEDLVPVIDELDPDHVDRALTRHQAGFDVLLSRPALPHPVADGPSGAWSTPTIPPGLYGACVALLAHDHDAVVVHVPRTLGSLTKSAVRLADETIVVSGADLMSLYGARRTLAFLRQEAHGTSVRIVLNITRRPEATAAEVERVLGSKPAARIRLDPAVAVAQATGRLVKPRGGRAWPEVARLAAALLPREPAAGAER